VNIHDAPATNFPVLKYEGKRNVILDSQLPYGMEKTIKKIAELNFKNSFKQRG